MSWIREWQTGFEMGRTSECDFTDGRIYYSSNDTTTSSPITGARSAYWNGPYGDFGHLFMHEPKMLRVNATLSINFGLGGFDIFRIYVRSGGQREELVLRWYPDEFKAELYYYRRASDTITNIATFDGPSEFVLHSDETPTSIGIVAYVEAYSSGWASVYIDGRKVASINLSPDNTNTSFYAAKIGGRASLSGVVAKMDDFYIDYSTIEEPDECPPSRRFLLMKPRSDGVHAEWTPISVGPNYEQVDDVISSDNEFNYTVVPAIIGPSGYPKDSFAMEVLSLPPDAFMVSAIPIARAKSGDIVDQHTLRFNAHGIADIATSDIDIKLGYTYLSERMTVAPSGGMWTQTEFNSCEFGYELRI